MKQAFMVMPFSDDIVRQAYEHCIKPIFKEKGIEIRKADEIFSTNPVYDDIVQEIQRAQIIVVDISGKNPNVFYELGIAHTLKQNQTIILTHDEYKGMPFDIAHFRIIHYDNTIEGSTRLKDTISHTIDFIMTDYNTLYKEEFQTVMNTLSYAGKDGDLYTLIGLKLLGGVIKAGESVVAEGHSPTGGSRNMSISAAIALKIFIPMGYVKPEGDSIYLTDKGASFIDFLLANGYVCDMMNSKVFSEGYVSFLDKREKKEG